MAVSLLFFFRSKFNSCFLQGSVDSCDTKETSDDEIDVSEITEEITKQVSY